MGTEDFDAWLRQLAAGLGGAVDARSREWLQTIFDEWGPLAAADVDELTELERERRLPLQRDAVSRLIPAVVADGRTAGLTLEIEVTLGSSDFSGLTVTASPVRGSRHYGASNGPLREIFATDADLLAWLADEVQEATMERDQVDCFVWPTCPVHDLGGHARVEDDVAVWRCHGGGGHVMARIGELGRAALSGK